MKSKLNAVKAFSLSIPSVISDPEGNANAELLWVALTMALEALDSCLDLAGHLNIKAAEFLGQRAMHMEKRGKVFGDWHIKCISVFRYCNNSSSL